MLAKDQTSVMLVENERLALADWGFASDSVFNTYFRGWDAAAKGLSVSKPEGYYILRQHLVMIWPYDAECRLVGEHVYENVALQQVVEIPHEDYITLDETRLALAPFLDTVPVAAV